MISHLLFVSQLFIQELLTNGSKKIVWYSDDLDEEGVVKASLFLNLPFLLLSQVWHCIIAWNLVLSMHD